MLQRAILPVGGLKEITKEESHLQIGYMNN